MSAVAGAVRAGFAGKDNLRLIQELGWRYVFGLARTWKFADGTHLKDFGELSDQETLSQSHFVQPRPTAARFLGLCALREIEHVRRCHNRIVQMMAQWRAKKIKLLVINLETQGASQILGIYTWQ